MVVAENAKAWIFVSTADPESFTEFIEWQSTGVGAIIERPNVVAAWRELNSVIPYEDSDTWKAADF